MLTVNGRVSLRRRWWHSPEDGSEVPADRVLSHDGATVTRGVRELACRLNNDAASFDKAADNLARAAQVTMSGEQLRQIVLGEGQRVQAAQQADAIRPAFTARDCRVAKGQTRTRLYVGVDGVMVPIVTDSEKQTRREKIIAKRRVAARKGRERPPLPPRRRGADQPYKEFKTITFYDESAEHHQVLLSRVRRTQVAPLLRREATRLKFLDADERLANVDGASWIPPQLDAANLQLHGRGLDFYHLAENVQAARRQVFGDEDTAGQTWATTLLHTLKHQGYEAAHESLLKWLSPLRAAKRAAAKKLLAYITERREMINYPEFLAHGWQLGSGPHRSPLPHQHRLPETLRSPLGSHQRRIRVCPHQPPRQRPMAILLVNSRSGQNLTSPNSLGTPRFIEQSRAAARGTDDPLGGTGAAKLVGPPACATMWITFRM